MIPSTTLYKTSANAYVDICCGAARRYLHWFDKEIESITFLLNPAEPILEFFIAAEDHFPGLDVNECLSLYTDKGCGGTPFRKKVKFSDEKIFETSVSNVSSSSSDIVSVSVNFSSFVQSKQSATFCDVA